MVYLNARIQLTVKFSGQFCSLLHILLRQLFPFVSLPYKIWILPLLIKLHKVYNKLTGSWWVSRPSFAGSQIEGMTACEEVDELLDCTVSNNALTRKENWNRGHKRSVQMPKHFQTLALQHWFIRFIAPTQTTPKVFSLGGREGSWEHPCVNPW